LCIYFCITFLFSFVFGIEWLEKHDKLPTHEQLLNVRNAKTDEEWEIAVWYWDVLLPVVAGREWWDTDRRHYQIIQLPEEINGKTGCYAVPASSEAFLILCFENNATKWQFMYEWDHADDTKNKPYPALKTEAKMIAKYTDSMSGKKEDGGWSSEGIQRMEALRQQLEDICQVEAESGCKNELAILDRVRKAHSITAASPDANGKKKKVPVEHVEFLVKGDESDDEDDSDIEDEEETAEEEQADTA
jgi:hypothetical protein